MMLMEEVAMTLIVGAGNARSEAMEAIQKARSGDLAAAREHLKAASAALIEAHHLQTDLIQQEAAGNRTELNLLMVHAQDHLMTAMTVKDLAQEFVALYAARFETK